MARRSSHKFSIEEILDKINARLGTRPLTKLEVDFLIDETYIEDVQDNELSISGVVAEIRRYRRTFVSSEKSQQGNAPKVFPKEEAKAHLDSSFALSLILYEEATKDAEVRAFRTEVLNDRLLDREMVPEWIERQAEADGEPTLLLELADIPLPRKDAMEILQRGTYMLENPANLAVKTFTTRFLKYGGGADNWTQVVPTRIDGLLERLRNLSERLAKVYDWQEAQATLFVLTGVVPFISPIQATNKMRRSSLYFNQHIVLDIDSTVSPQEVAKCYRLYRKSIKARRTGNLSEKHLRLATFNAERPREETWAKKLEEWNRSERSDWGYGNDRRRFAHDCLQARRRLLHIEKE